MTGKACLRKNEKRGSTRKTGKKERKKERSFFTASVRECSWLAVDAGDDIVVKHND